MSSLEFEPRIAAGVGGGGGLPLRASRPQRKRQEMPERQDDTPLTMKGHIAATEARQAALLCLASQEARELGS